MSSLVPAAAAKSPQCYLCFLSSFSLLFTKYTSWILNTVTCTFHFGQTLIPADASALSI